MTLDDILREIQRLETAAINEDGFYRGLTPDVAIAKAEWAARAAYAAGAASVGRTQPKAKTVSFSASTVGHYPREWHTQPEASAAPKRIVVTAAKDMSAAALESGAASEEIEAVPLPDARAVSDACAEGRHADCTQTLDQCHCTWRGDHKTMHAYASMPDAEPGKHLVVKANIVPLAELDYIMLDHKQGLLWQVHEAYARGAASQSQRVRELEHDVAEHVRWVLKDAARKHDMGLSTHGDGIWYNKRAEKAERELAEAQAKILQLSRDWLHENAGKVALEQELAEARVALDESLIVLAALLLGTTWELAPTVREQIQAAHDKVESALRRAEEKKGE